MLQSQGVVRLVGYMGRPVPIPDYEIDSLRTLAETHRSKIGGSPVLPRRHACRSDQRSVAGRQVTFDSRGKTRAISAEREPHSALGGC